MAAPTLTSQTGSTWNDQVNTNEVTGTLTWNSGDSVLVIGFTEDQSLTLSTPTATGLTFTDLGTPMTAANSCWAHAWQATAASSGSGAITGPIVGGSGMRGIHALAFGGCTGFVRTDGAAVNSTQTVSVTRTQANSFVAFLSADWSASGTSGLGWTPAGQTQLQAATTTGASAFAAYWGDQGGTGTTSYGTTGLPGTAFSKFAVEILGTASAAVPYAPLRQLRPPDPGETYWTQRDRRDANLVGTPSNPLPSPLDSAWQSGGRYWHATNDWTRPAWYAAQRTLPDPALLAAPAASVPYQSPRTPAVRDSGEVPWLQPRRSDPSLLATAQLENELLGAGDTARHYLIAATHAARPGQAQQRAPLAAPDDVQIVGTGATGGWWGIDDTVSYLGQRRATDPALLAGPAVPFDPLLAGWLPLWLSWNRAATHADRREVPQQRPYLSDPSFYPTVPPTDPLTLAWGAGGIYWLLYNRATTHVERREVPQQRPYVSDPALLASALLEDALLGGWDDRLRHYLVAAYADRRQVPQQRTPEMLAAPDADPVLLAGAVGGDLWRRYTLPVYADRREVPQQPQREWLYFDAGPGLPPLTLAFGAGGAYWHLYNRPSRSRSWWPQLQPFPVEGECDGLTHRPYIGVTTRPAGGTTSRPRSCH